MIKKVLIAGAGIRGKRLGTFFKKIEDIEVAYIDNNEMLWGTEINEITCYPMDAFVEEDKDVIVLISPENAEGLYKQCSSLYSNIIYNKRIIDVLANNAFVVGYEDFLQIGHFYSTYPIVDEVLSKPDYANIDMEHAIPGIDFNQEKQYETLQKMMTYYDKVFTWNRIEDEKDSPYRFKRGNESISDADALGLFCMLNVVKPKRLIEVGSGHSSAITLDVNEYFFDNKISLHFIEPYADRFKSILKESDNVDLQEVGLQDIELPYFDQLGAGDILFIDSTHVSKAGSDVNYLFFEILPRLKSGVIIHLHDIFYPFEYPHEWIKRGTVWNELYLLRAFLQYNADFEIIYFQNMMEKFHREEIEAKWPIENSGIHGGSFWMRKK